MKPIIIDQKTGPGDHEWRVCTNICDLKDIGDATVAHMVQAVRDAYGESEILALAVDPDVESMFDVGSVLAGFRKGLPNPAAEGKKPRQLRTSRSEAAEFYAREILRIVSNIQTPPALHAVKGNALQPMLGYDGWGVTAKASGLQALVLIQVKGSDDPSCPPAIAKELVHECSSIVVDLDKLARALSACIVRVKGTSIAVVLLGMLEMIGKGVLPPIVVAPVIVRGSVSPQMGDLAPIEASVGSFGQVTAYGMTVSIGAPLDAFGEFVMNKARGR